MKIYSEFPQAWWTITIIFYVSWLILFLRRKTYKHSKELTSQIVFALIILILSFIIENIGIPNKLWTYYPGNWPIILWVNYFGSGLLGYQLLKKVEEFTGK